MIVEVVAVLALIAFLIYRSTQKPPELPPGSFGLPVIGSLPPRNVQITTHLGNLKKKYGRIYTTKWGSRVIIVLADAKIIKLALNHTDFQGRVDFFTWREMMFHMNIGVVNSSGKVWQDNRRFLLRHLRDLGMGKTRLEVAIQDEAEMLVQYLEKHCIDKPTKIDESVNASVLNVIWQMIACKRFEIDDPKVFKYIDQVAENIDALQGSLFLFDIMPWLVPIVPNFVKNKFMKLELMHKNRNDFVGMYREAIEEHEATLDPDNPRDIIDYYLLEIEAGKDDPDTTFRADKKDLIQVVWDMFGAGSETTATTLRWMIVLLALHPEIQKKAHEQLDKVVSKDCLPSLDDRSQLAYIDAMLLDVMRKASLFPISFPHCATATVNFEGYIIPKGAMLLACSELCHKDPELWDHPDEFYPEHFLDKDGKLDSKKEGFMPFSLGRRQCLGESLARMELFLFASAILQRFTIEAPPGVTLRAETDPSQKLLNSPRPYKVVLKRRS